MQFLLSYFPSSLSRWPFIPCLAEKIQRKLIGKENTTPGSYGEKRGKFQNIVEIYHETVILFSMYSMYVIPWLFYFGWQCIFPLEHT